MGIERERVGGRKIGGLNKQRKVRIKEEEEGKGKSLEDESKRLAQQNM